MVKTFKYKSWVFTIAAGLVSFIAALNIEQVKSILPMEYSYLPSNYVCCIPLCFLRRFIIPK